MATETTGAEDAVDSAVEKGVVDSPTTTTGTEAAATQAGEGAGLKGKSEEVPYERFKEVNDLKNEYKEQFDKQASQLEALQTEAQEQSELLDAIRSLKFDDRTSEAVTIIDKALRGELEEVDDAEALDQIKQAVEDDDPGKGLQILQQRLEDRVESAEESIAEQRAELLLTAAQQQATRYLEDLPEEYTDDDKAIIGKLWTGEVDWDSIESDPSQLSTQLVDSLQVVLDEYGTPRGAYETSDDTETVEVKAPPTNAEQLDALMANEELSAFDKDGNPVVSDDDFAGQLAKALHLSRD